jgi:hypothetical protein
LHFYTLSVKSGRPSSGSTRPIVVVQMPKLLALACTMHEAMDFVDHQSEYRDVEA